MRRFAPWLREGFGDFAGRFDQHEELAGQWEERFRRGESVALAEERLLAVTGRLMATRLVAVQLTNLAARVVNLANGVTTLCNANNAHSIPAVARSLYESAGAVTYMRRNLIPLLAKGRAERARVMLFRLGLGADPGTDAGFLMPYRVSAFVSSMSQEAGDLARLTRPPYSGDHEEGETWGQTMARMYSMLAEHTHPNSGASHLSITLFRGEPTWTLQPPLTESDLELSLGPCFLSMHFGRVAWDAVMDAADAHPLVLPYEDDFSPGDVHGDPPEALC